MALGLTFMGHRDLDVLIKVLSCLATVFYNQTLAWHFKLSHE
jgi:hypothetical protein